MTITETLKQKFPNAILGSHADYGDETVMVDPAHIISVLRFLKENTECPFEQLLDLCGVDYSTHSSEGKEFRFEVVYHLYSLSKIKRLRLRVKIPEDRPVIDSSIEVYPAADWFEREAFDMFGIQFNHHPNLKRLLMWTHFEGHPLRKNYPVNKRQALPTLDDIV